MNSNSKFIDPKLCNNTYVINVKRWAKGVSRDLKRLCYLSLLFKIATARSWKVYMQIDPGVLWYTKFQATREWTSDWKKIDRELKESLRVVRNISTTCRLWQDPRKWRKKKRSWVVNNRSKWKRFERLDPVGNSLTELISTVQYSAIKVCGIVLITFSLVCKTVQIPAVVRNVACWSDLQVVLRCHCQRDNCWSRPML